MSLHEWLISTFRTPPHHSPSCTAVWNEEHAPHHPAAKACLDRDPALRLVLKPGRMLAPSRRRTPLRERASLRKFVEPSDDFHHRACLSSVRACGGLRRPSRSCGSPHGRADTTHSAWLVRALFQQHIPLRKAVKPSNGHPHIVTQGAGRAGAPFRRVHGRHQKSGGQKQPRPSLRMAVAQYPCPELLLTNATGWAHGVVHEAWPHSP